MNKAIITLLLLSGAAHAGGIYQCADENGVPMFSDSCSVTGAEVQLNETSRMDGGLPIGLNAMRADHQRTQDRNARARIERGRRADSAKAQAAIERRHQERLKAFKQSWQYYPWRRNGRVIPRRED